MPSHVLLDTKLDGLSLVRRGKVRDVYAVGDDLIIVATDRISAFDYVLGSGIPDKGRVLNQLSAFWFGRTGDIIAEPSDHRPTSPTYPGGARALTRRSSTGRSMLVRRTTPLPVECVARGYISGSGWKDYKATGEVCGIPLPEGLRESDRLPEPLFTPATKAESGHDENISEAAAAQVVGAELLARLKTLTLALYAHGVAHAESKRHHPRRHQVRVRPDRRRRAAADRRDDDAGLVALLAEGHVRARRAAAELRQAVRARLPRVDQVEQAAAGAVAARPTSSSARATSIWTPTGPAAPAASWRPTRA